MSAEDAGSIYSEVRIRLDKLQADITQAVTSMDRFGSTVVDMSNTTSNLFSNNYSKSIQNVKTYLASLDGAVKSGAMTQKQAIEESIAVRKQELAFIQATAARKGGYTTQEINDSKTVRAELDKLETEYKDLYAAEDKAGKGAASFSAASVAAAAVVALAFRSLVTATSEYSAALAGVRAATRGSTEEMDQFASAAESAAKQYGKTNAEALQGIEALAKAGVSTADILGGGLDGAMALAAAGELAVGDAAEIASSAMTQFGLDGTKVTHIADLLAAGAGKAQGEVTDLAAGLKYVGPVAAGMNVSIEKVVGTLALLASNGIMADQAGSGLRGVLSAMTAPSKIAREEMERLGISVYDSAGNFKGLSNLGGELSRTLAGATDAERDMSLGMIFGNEQITVARTLLKGGSEAIDEWTAKVDDAGFATETAGIKLDSLDGDLKKLDASTKNVAASLGSAGEPALRGFAQVATTVLNAISALPGPVKTALVTIGGLAGGLIAFAAAGPAAIGVIKGIGLAVSTSLGPVGLIASAVGILAVGLTTAAAASGAFDSSTDKLIRNSKDLQDSISKNNAEFTKIVGPVNSSTAANKLSADQIDQLKKLYPELTKTMNLNKATIGEVAEAQKKLNAERNKDAISAINQQIKANNDLVAIQNKQLEDAKKKQDELSDSMGRNQKTVIKNYEAKKEHTAVETKNYERAKEQLENLKKNTEAIADNGRATAATSQGIRESIALLQKSNRELQIEKEKLDGTADARIAEAAARQQEAADKAAAAAAAKLAIEREMQARKDLITQYQKDMAVNKAMLDKKLIDEEEYLKGIVEISNARISQLQSDAKKDGEISDKNKAAWLAEIAIRDNAAGKLDGIAKKKADAAAEERKLQDALNDTVESMKAEIAELDALGAMTQEQTARRELLAKKVKAIEDKSAKDKEASEEKIRAAEKLTSEFSTEFQNRKLDAIDAETFASKSALKKQVDDLYAANALMLASDQKYADQSSDIAKYAAEQEVAINQKSIEDRVAQNLGYVNSMLGMMTGLFTAIGELQQALSDAQLELLDEQYNKRVETMDAETQALLENLDEETQAKLVAAGLQDKTAVESAQLRLDDAIAKGDEKLIAEAEDELARAKILEEAAAKKKGIEDKAIADKLAAETAYNKKKAQLEYKSALEQWKMQLLNASVAGAQAIISGLAAGLQVGGIPGIVLGAVTAAAAGVTTGIQIAAINDAKPKPPALATGGIAIPSMGGAEVLVAENGSPEMMLNGGASGEAFLNQFADKVAQRIMMNNGGQNITIVNELDSMVLSRAVVRNIDNGTVRVKGLA